MADKVTSLDGRPRRGKVKAIFATVRLLYQMDARAFLISTTTGMIESLF